MPRSLVTGATGFVGANLVGMLRRRGWDVVCLVRDRGRTAEVEQLGARFELGSLSDRASIDRAIGEVDVVFHVAGRVRALNEKQFYEDNVVGTRNMVEACASRATRPATVIVSSLAAGGPSRPGAPRCETDTDAPVSCYGRSKLAAEHAARALADEVPISIVRPPIIFGPGDRASLALFRGVQMLRLHLVPGLRRFPVSLVHVADLCDALVELAERGERITKHRDDSTGVYYIASERTIDYRELGHLAATALGCRGVAIPLPKALFWCVGGIVEMVGQLRRQPMVLNLDKIREAVAPGWVCCDERLRQNINYRPQLPLEQRFADTAAWYRQHGWL